MNRGIVVGIVEDDEFQAEMLSLMVQAAGMRSEVFRSGALFLRRRGEQHIDVLLLDWKLPDISGIDLIKRLRDGGSANLPIILVTAMNDERDLVYGFAAGADDYIVKPPRAPELIARVRAVHRRNGGSASAVKFDTPPFTFDLRARELKLDGKAVATTEREFDLLVYLFQRPNRIVSRKMLLVDVWRLPDTSTARSVDTFVSRMRTSFGLNGSSGWRLDGVYQHGYRLVRLDDELAGARGEGEPSPAL